MPTDLVKVQAAGTTSLTDASTGRFVADAGKDIGNSVPGLDWDNTSRSLSTDTTARVDIFGQ